uniref:Uncharacterized protein n=1 Tax=Lepeophtheirus salmonis TaxID=72036 RepID=A0A0K2VEA0_LEPSM
MRGRRSLSKIPNGTVGFEENSSA